MNAQEFLKQVVEPNIEELKADQLSFQRAFNAIASVDALAAQIFHCSKALSNGGGTGVKNDLAYRQELAKQNKDFALIRDAAKAQKHVVLDRGSPRVTNADQIATGETGWGQGGWGDGNWGGGESLQIKDNSGGLHNLIATLDRAKCFLEEKL